MLQNGYKSFTLPLFYRDDCNGYKQKHVQWQKALELTKAEKEALLVRKPAVNQLCIAAMLKYFQNEGCFPETTQDLFKRDLLYIKKTLKIKVAISSIHKLPARNYTRFQTEIRMFLGIGAISATYYEQTTEWLCCQDIEPDNHEPILIKLQTWFQEHNLEFPRVSQQRKIIKDALRLQEQRLFASIYNLLNLEIHSKIDDILARSSEEGDFRTSVFTGLKTDPACPSLDTVMGELKKLEVINEIGLPHDLFHDTSTKTIH